MSFIRKIFQFRETPDPASVKPFLEHLEDLRWTLIKMAGALIAGMIVAFSFRVEIMHILQKPLRDIDPELVNSLQVLGILDPLVISLKLAFYVGIIITFPFLIYFLAQFIVPALTGTEKKLVIPVILGGFMLFAGGVCFAYFYVLPQTLRFFFGFSAELELVQRPTAVSYFSFVSHMSISLGAAFELPMVVLALNYLGLLSFQRMKQTRIFAIPILFALAAVIAPTPDPFTLFAVAVPMCLLYEACIWLIYLLERARSKKSLATMTAGE